ncbi:UDP-glucuronosyltransferase 2C1-like [Branchiostoma floridae]|uniref:UDP-glucuronosyltransferase n=1 Tax=Branchiostoma floridae TaxID=7739 RepID=A0A9J7MCF6_BRAFL|nr:UDP-glucuronosyltransferase 2C1-like [Branchiostoma floridae]
MAVVSKSSTLLLVFLGLLITQRISAENVLLVPTPCTESLWFTLSNIGQALVGRGHIVTVVVPEDIAEERRAERPDFKFETFRDQGTHALLKEIDAQDLSNIESETSVYQYARDVTSTTDVITKHCDLLLGDIDLMSRLKAANFSLVVYDCCYPFGAMLAPHMDSRVPYIATLRTELYFLRASGVPLPLSYVPFWGFDFTDNMNFVQRVENVFTYSLLSILGPWLATNTYDELVRKYISEKETIKSVVSNTDLWLYQTDHVLDFPAPSMPNMVQIGGLHIGAVSPLPKELETFVQSAGNDGVIVVSFGSIVKTMSSKKTRIFAAAFARLRQKVVWRYTGEKPAGLGNNTKLMAWIPQNDLLGHPMTRAFITHAGARGMYEALHHGVPMVCLPLFFDQPGNAARVVARGLGVKLEFSTVTTDELYQAITHVLTNNSYHKTAARLSRLYRDQPQSPMERAVWWIEHVIKYGGLPHLRARAVELPWYQYHLLDVAVFLFAVCTAVLGTVWYSCSFVCKKMRCKIGAKVKSQ